MPLSPGSAIFEYRISRTLGQGAFGTVYLAQDTLLDRPVAIKELTPAAEADPVAFQRFLQEARAAGSLNHPNIVTVYALKPTDTAVYLVMEYLPGGSLRSRLPVEDAARIAADVCDGLAAAHARGIVHRDVKPGNILLTADGRAKVGDFGIAHVPRTAGSAIVDRLTDTGFQPGTLAYMSPEQIRGEEMVCLGPRAATTASLSTGSRHRRKSQLLSILMDVIKARQADVLLRTAWRQTVAE